MYFAHLLWLLLCVFERLKISDFLWPLLKVFYQHWDTECVLLTPICQSISLICSPVISFISAQYILEIYFLRIYIGQDYPENIYVSLLTNPFTTLTFSINWNGSDMHFSGWLAHYMKTIFVGGGGSSIRYAVKHMHIYWPNPRLLYTSGFPRHTIHTHSQPIGKADKYQEQKRQ